MTLTSVDTLTAASTEAAVHATALRKHFGDVHAVDGVDLTIPPGEVVALLGPNGAGKSTTVDMLLGLTAPDAGAVSLLGQSPRDAVRAGKVGAMLQAGALRDHATVAETIGCVAALHGRSGQTAAILERAGIDDLARRRCGKLSGGQRQRVRFALALVSEPELIMLDEPTVAMDVQIRRGFWELMRDYTDSGHTVLFATHYLEEAQEFADRVIFLRQGRIAADGTVAEIRARVAGRMITADIPRAEDTELRSLPAVTAVDRRGDHATLHSGDSDTTLRELLRRFPTAQDIEVTAVGLEEAFLTLAVGNEEQ